MKSANASSGQSVDDNVFELDQRCFSGNIGGLQMIFSSRLNSHRDFKRIDETRGEITAEEGDLLVSERNIDRQSHTHHTRQVNEGIFGQNSQTLFFLIGIVGKMRKKSTSKGMKPKLYQSYLSLNQF